MSNVRLDPKFSSRKDDLKENENNPATGLGKDHPDDPQNTHLYGE